MKVDGSPAPASGRGQSKKRAASPLSESEQAASKAAAFENETDDDELDNEMMRDL